eukprot:44582-Eustigmatos_ZCMA.PRE.1
MRRTAVKAAAHSIRVVHEVSCRSPGSETVREPQSKDLRREPPTSGYGCALPVSISAGVGHNLSLPPNTHLLPAAAAHD